MDKIKQYLALHEALVKEKAELEKRLAEINKALGARVGLEAAAPAKAPAKAAAVPPKKSGRGRRGNKFSLREAVLEVTKNGPLTKQEILDRVKKLGYRFQTKDPMNTLNVVLYTNKKYIKNYGGKFGPA